MTPDDSRHGTLNGYSNLGCRCAECRAAKADETRRRRAERRQRLRDDPSIVRHGLAVTYSNWCCRCRPCTDAWAIYIRVRRLNARYSGGAA